MTAAAKDTFGTVFKMADTGGTPVAIAELTDITPPALSRAALDATSHDSADGADEVIYDGVISSEAFTVEGHLIGDSTADLAFANAMKDKAVQDWVIEFKAASGTATRSGSGLVTNYALGPMPVQGGKQTFSATIKPTGPITGPTA